MTATDRKAFIPQRPPQVPHFLLTLLVLSILLTCGRNSPADETELGVQVIDGFEVTLFADDEQAHDVYSLTIDSLGRVVVSGAGYVRILEDTTGDGRADVVKTFVDGPRTGAQGMYFHGRDLLCAGDGGLIRYRDQDGDDRADGSPDLFLRIRTGNEHDLHAIRKGPDGWWYLIAGNSSGVNEHYAMLPTSPIRQPQAGVVLRMLPDLTRGEIFAHGSRNAYDFDFNDAGDLLTFDSDGEREMALPWYLPTRVFHVPPGADLGWRSLTWKRPNHFFDMPPVIAEFGRGSPTGVVCYRHQQFPEQFQGALFVLDWTFGRVFALPLQPDGSSWSSEPIPFMSAVGQHGFAPTDAEVGPDGALYVAVGGRGTRGSVYRIRAVGRPEIDTTFTPPQAADEQLEACLKAPQPLSSWSRRRWEPLANQLGDEPFRKAALDTTRSAAQRVRAIEILTEKFGGLDLATSNALAEETSPEVRARAAWSIGRTLPQAPNAVQLTPFLKDSHPLVARQALEALSSVQEQGCRALIQPLGEILAHPDRNVRQAAMRVLARCDAPTRLQAAKIGIDINARAAIPVGAADALAGTGYRPLAVDLALRTLRDEPSVEIRREAARILQLGLGDLFPPEGTLPPIFSGYAASADLTAHEASLDQIRISLDKLYPSGDRELDLELERAVSMVQPAHAGLYARILQQITDQSDPVDDIHRLIVLTRFQVVPTAQQREQIADILVRLDEKISQHKYQQDAHFDDRRYEIYTALCQQDPRLPLAVIGHDRFGQAGHVQYMSEVPEEQFEQALSAFVRQIRETPDYAWNSDVIYLVGEAEEPEDRALILQKFDDFALRGAVLTCLSDRPQPEDRPYFVAGLEFASMEVLALCIQALGMLPPSTDPEENVQLAITVRKLGETGDERMIRDQTVELLQRNLNTDHGYTLGREGDPQREAVSAWVQAVSDRFPEQFARHLGAESENIEELQRTLASVSWNNGDAARGQQLFDSRGCIQCHGARRALGPDLSGVTGRFSREDLFTAIVFPNLDVSPRYQTTQVATRDGHVRTGMIVYEAIDSLVLRDANNQTYRFGMDEIELRRTLNQSLMPAGLLKGLRESDLADLYAYLRTLGASATSTASSPPAPTE